MTDTRALDYSLRHALSRMPSRGLRNAWIATNEIEQRVVSSSIREYLAAGRWSFRRQVIVVADSEYDPLDPAIDEGITACGNDPRAALKALLLVANDFLETESDAYARKHQRDFRGVNYFGNRRKAEKASGVVGLLLKSCTNRHSLSIR